MIGNKMVVTFGIVDLRREAKIIGKTAHDF